MNIHQLKVLARVPIPARDSDRWNQLTWAINAWRRAALSDRNMATCENAARELEIERENGEIVHLNVRTG
jgi:hypothetical protein